MEEEHGHRIEGREPFDAHLLQHGLIESLGLARFDFVESTGSTNADLLAAVSSDVAAYPDLSVLVADHQSAGRGRLDRHWEAPPRAALAVSIVLRPVNLQGRPLPSDSYSWFSLLAAEAWCQALVDVCGVTAQVKWPNDLMVGERKLAGILAQLHFPTDGAPPVVVLGAGVNVSLGEDELPVPTATSLRLLGGRPLDRTALVAAYLRRFTALYKDYCNSDGDADAGLAGGGSVHHRLTRSTVTLGRTVRAHLPGDHEVTGVAVRLDHHGSLVIRDGDGHEHTVTAGDVIHLRPHVPDGHA
ncbi:MULTISPECIES: biotin--[acetyl-CoA-carboxylase] ligase [Arthrobacter]|uniref:biotin--[biotin carboxyl-carrier protein] ligase n=2 Tax=Arthrobacter TaxID=1663 RepID=A0ABU9KN92_9MICC|nr:biotin--[acetyl-CoA-carboxylase] ligase [Arthrobacter sp. YJM1]MDP5228338.1 biotin--[acetyl-CoA-carboxylase] ligase [Arthrobacter sp. YJM1]